MTLEIAERMIVAAVRKAEEMKVPECIAVTDEGGNLVAFKRMDGASYFAINIAIDKAYSAGFGWPTDMLGKVAQPGEFAYGLASTNNGRSVIFAGGEPIIENGKVIGAIGVSGGKSPDDKAIAEAGAKAIS